VSKEGRRKGDRNREGGSEGGRDLAYGEDNRPHIVIESGCPDGFLVSLGSTGFFAEDKSCADPDGVSAEHQRSGQGLAVEESTSCYDQYVVSRQGAFLTLYHLDNSGDEDGGRDVSSVATSFTSLSTDDIRSYVEALLYMFRVADHVHIEDASLVEAVNDRFWRHTDSRDEELCLAVNDDADQLVEFALGIVVARTGR
jgi:hypothetical protein